MYRRVLRDFSIKSVNVTTFSKNYVIHILLKLQTFDHSIKSYEKGITGNIFFGFVLKYPKVCNSYQLNEKNKN